MTDNGSHSASELLAVMSSRVLEDGQTVFAGVGIPLLAATLAQRIHAPGLTILFEGGVLGPFIVPGELPPSTNEQRCTRQANMVLSNTDVLLLLQRGYVDIGFMGGAQIDRYGNLNSSFIGDADDPKIRLPGTGGGNDIASLTRMIVSMIPREAAVRGKCRLRDVDGLLARRRHPQRFRFDDGRPVPGDHRPRDPRLRRGNQADEGRGAA